LLVVVLAAHDTGAEVVLVGIEQLLIFPLPQVLQLQLQ
jgi:hypothetical protein